MIDSEEVFMLPYSLEDSDGYIVHKNGVYLLYINGHFMGQLDNEKLLEEPFKTMPILEENNETSH